MDTYKWMVEQEQDLLYLVEDWLRSNEMYNEDEETGLEVCTVCNAPVECRCPIEDKEDHECGICGRLYHWSADDIAWEYEKSPFMPCGDKWEFLDRVVE